MLKSMKKLVLAITVTILLLNVNVNYLYTAEETVLNDFPSILIDQTKNQTGVHESPRNGTRIVPKSEVALTHTSHKTSLSHRFSSTSPKVKTRKSGEDNREYYLNIFIDSIFENPDFP